MDYRRLGASGFTVPVISFGTGTFGGKGEFFSQWGGSGIRLSLIIQSLRDIRQWLPDALLSNVLRRGFAQEPVLHRQGRLSSDQLAVRLLELRNADDAMLDQPASTIGGNLLQRARCRAPDVSAGDGRGTLLSRLVR
jgi:hypothetical protein